MEDSTIIQICSSAVLALAGAHARHVRISRVTLEQWEANNGCEILDSQYRHFFKGPFFLKGFKGQTVYYLRFSDRDGRLRSGWIRFRGSYFEMSPDLPEEKWDADNWPSHLPEPPLSSGTAPAGQEPRDP
jgi:hypothetical protein